CTSSLLQRPTPRTEIDPPSLHDALPICCRPDVSEREDLSTHRTQSRQWVRSGVADDEPGRSVHRFTECAPHDDEVSHAPGRTHRDRKSTRLNSSHVSISYAVFCLTKTTQ